MTDPTPVEIDDATLAFPASALEFMPKWEDIPEAFRDEGPFDPEAGKWRDFQQTWFAVGLDKRFSFQPAEGLSGLMIYRQLSAIQGTYACKHEHKIAAVAWLASLWMDSVIYGPPDCPDDKLKVIGAATRDEWLEHFAEAEAKDA